MQSLLLLLAAASAPVEAQNEVVVTAAREPIEKADAPASVSVIDGETLSTLGLPLAVDAIRLLPGVSVATSGPPGSQSQLRIRGAEANHSLIFVDGIRFNDPAAANEARFELLASDSLSRLELIRGPQSALWGSEALGGVVAVTSADPHQGNALSGRVEYGSHDSVRLSGQGTYRIGPLGISASAGWIRSDGVDATSFDGGDRDGFSNRNASIKAVYAPSGDAEIGVVGHWIGSENEFDGSDPFTFAHADTQDYTRNRILAGRTWFRKEWGGGNGWILTAESSLLGSRNRNFDDDGFLNRTAGRRFTLGGQLTKRFAIGATRHQITGAVEHEREHFRSRNPDDPDTFWDESEADQKQSRSLEAFVFQWRTDWSDRLATDLSIRQDSFSDFSDATTVRAAMLFRPSTQWTLHAAYGEGIAQPTFYDLFGFFPDDFIGNPDLKPERGTNWEAGLRWSRAGTTLGVTAFRARLRDEIQTVSLGFPLSTAINAAGTSRRRGFELEAEHRFTGQFSIRANYSFVDADQPDTNGGPIREVRRAKHSGNIMLSWNGDPLRIAASLAYAGKRFDTNFDVFPSERVTLHDYMLASLSLGYTLSRGIEAYARIENALGEDHEDAFGYATPGRTIHAGLRIRLGD